MYPVRRHPTWWHPVGLLITLLLSISLASCNFYNEPDRHKLFKELMRSNIGSMIDKPKWVGSVIPEQLNGSRHLPNGNIENEYRYKRSCRSIFEFDPETRIIVNWRFEGPKTDCFLH